jgi:hypothetical protein
MVLLRGKHFTFMYAIDYGGQEFNIIGIDAVSALLCRGCFFYAGKGGNI